MADHDVRGLRVAILSNDYFEQPELTEPMKALKEAGAEVQVISTKPGEIQGVHHAEMGDKVKVDLTLDRANADDYDALVLPGGALNADSLRMDKRAQEFVRAFDSSRRPIAVICHGPWLLASAGLTRGRKITSYYTIQDDLRNAGAEWQDSECLVDGNWVSSRQPSDIPRFNAEMLRVFGEQKSKGKRAA